LNRKSNLQNDLRQKIIRKQRELDRRGKRANALLLRSDDFIENQEQWEAFQECVDHQHKKMTKLIHEIITICSILEQMDR
jgi:hypothetical protein